MRHYLIALFLQHHKFSKSSLSTLFAELESSLPPQTYAALYQEYESACLLMQTMPTQQRIRIEQQINKTLTTALKNRSAADLHAQLRFIQDNHIMPHAFSHPSSMYWQQYPGLMPMQMMPHMHHYQPVWRTLTAIAVCALIYLGVKALKNQAAGSEIRKHKLDQHCIADAELVTKCIRGTCHALLRGRLS